MTGATGTAPRPARSWQPAAGTTGRSRAEAGRRRPLRDHVHPL